MTTENGTSADRFTRHATFTIERHYAFPR
ncbi:MAG: hypothetical protein K0S16_2237, partial [Moraxellaceae bacterium]|nr:hypothetical protein [Moraxellaceae bacterium]